MDKLACALKDVPQSIINQIITEQMKKKVREVVEDDAFNDSYLQHKNNNKLFKNMDWINSLIFSVWMYKYH